MTLHVGLCRNRHRLPTKTYLLEKEVTMDFARLENDIRAAIDRETPRGLAGEPQVRFVECYVTGFTPATVALINVCRDMGLGLILLHYNRDTGWYERQEVRS